jgi:anti-sigma factor (TIGR02949 family)
VSTEHDHGTCRELLDHISTYIDGELEAAICDELETHLAECPDCRIMVDTVRRTITLYRAQAATDLPSGVQDRLYKVLDLEK